MEKISVTILTKNAADSLALLLQKLSCFDEVLVLDNGSTDNTVATANSFPHVTVHTSPFIGFGPLHNLASSLAKHDWILSIDSDELPTDVLLNEISSLSLDPSVVYSIPRHNYYRGKWIRFCGWHPESVLRLYNKKETAFSASQVHEKVQAKKVIALKGALIHTPYRHLSDFLAKMQHYSTLFAEQNAHRSSSPFKATFHALFAFFKSYFLKRGFLGGYEGFLISCYMAQTAFFKYLKLYEKSGKKYPNS